MKPKVLKLRFPFSGQVSWVGVEDKQEVKKGEVIARLDTTILKLRHQKHLKDYEKIRASFEQIKKKKQNVFDPDQQYILDRAQADLDSAVLAVEISNHELKRTNLIAPLDGVVNNKYNVVPGMNISPATFPFELTVKSSKASKPGKSKQKSK